MKLLLMTVLSILGILLLCILVFLLYFLLSPMPVIRLLRGNKDPEPVIPPGYDKELAQVEIKPNVTYPSAYGRNQMDLYLPRQKGVYPLILWVHGGAFVAGDKRGIEQWGVKLAAQGYVVAAMNYEWAPEVSYPSQLIQIKEALETLRQLSDSDSRIDLTRTALAGDSAGAHMAAQFVLLHKNPLLAGRLNIVSPLAADALKCALLYCGPYDFKRMMNLDNKMMRLFVSRIGWSYLGQKNWQKAPLVDTITPMDYVTADCVPVYITDGNHGSFESHGKALGETLRNAGVDVKERYFDTKDGEVNHEYQMQLETENAMLCFKDTVEFLEKYFPV